MPIQSDKAAEAEWTARAEKQPRSVFSNYTVSEPATGPAASVPSATLPADGSSPAGRPKPRELGLQAAIDTAVARTFLYQFLARAFADPMDESWQWLTSESTRAAFLSAARTLAPAGSFLLRSAAALLEPWPRESLEPFQIAYVTAFGHAARGDCPLNEIEYGDLKADPLFQPHRLADLAAFYRAFGLEVADDAAERPDHIGMELEFMSVLAAREAYALERQLDDDFRELSCDAQKKFLREHLGRWAPAFGRRLARIATCPILAALAEFLREFVTLECARFGLIPGSEDLLLRRVDEAAESLCASCGLQHLPPGGAALEGLA